MTKQSKTVLNHLREISDNTDCTLCYLGDTTQISRFDNYNVFYDYIDYHSEIHSIIDFLVSAGYLVYTNDAHNDFSLTHKGLHPYRVSWISVKSFLFRSVITPIVVSAATTLVTLALSSILG